MDCMNGICGNEDSVNEMMDKLLNADVISKENKRKLIEVDVTNLDPNILMDLRHKVSRIRNCYSGDKKHINNGSINSILNNKEEQLNIEDLLKVDKEIKDYKLKMQMDRRKLLDICSIQLPNNFKNETNSEIKMVKKSSEKKVKLTSNVHLNKIRDNTLNSIITTAETPETLKADTNREKIKRNCSAKSIKEVKIELEVTNNKFNNNETSDIKEKENNSETHTSDIILFESTENLKVDSLKEPKFVLLQKFWFRWKEHTAKRKKYKEQNKCTIMKDKKLNYIFSVIQDKVEHQQCNRSDTITKNAVRSHSNNYKPKPITKNNCAIIGSVYDQRYKFQESIIAKQKNMLDQQKKIIEDLQREQFKLESALAIKEESERLSNNNNRAKKLLKRKVKQETKIRNNIGEQKCTRTKKVKTPEVLRRMKEREQERKSSREALKERKRQLESEKQKKEEKEKQMKIEEERKLKLIQIKNKREQQRLIEEERLKNAERGKELIRRAEDFYNRTILLKTFTRWKNFVEEIKRKIVLAMENHHRTLLAKSFKIWKLRTDESINLKYNKAKELYEHRIKTKCFSVLLNNYHDGKAKINRAEVSYNLKLLRKCYKHWIAYKQEKISNLEKLSIIATQHYTRNLIKRCFTKWKRIPQVMQEEREKKQRIRVWKDIVKDILPDFSSVSE